MYLKKLNYLKFYNLINLFKVIFSRIFLRFLSRDLDIPKWHLNATYYVREYKSKVIGVCNTFKSDIEYIIEVGCGTGELISRVDINNKIGIDIDKNVLTLCNRLHPKLNTLCLDVMSDYNTFLNKLNNIEKDKNIMIVMINWLHIYKKEEANFLIENLLLLDRNILIVVDIYSRIEFSKRTDNKIKHDFSKIKKIKWTKIFEEVDKVRDIALFSNFKLKKVFNI